MINFLIISCGYRCEDTIQKCIDSVEGQSYKNWYHCIVIDGDSEHSNMGLVIKASDKRFATCLINRSGKMKHFCFVVDEHCGPWPEDALHNISDTIIIDLDADDYLEPNALEILAKIYQDPNIWATHGSYKMLSGRPARFNGEYKNDNFRGQKFKGTHLKSFRAPLFYKIKPKDFKGRDGKWLMTASDLAIMMPILEMSGLDRIKYVPEVIYNYNDLSDLNDHKVDPEGQKRIEKIIRKRPRYKRLESL